jgi:hypothetical protein
LALGWTTYSMKDSGAAGVLLVPNHMLPSAGTASWVVVAYNEVDEEHHELEAAEEDEHEFPPPPTVRVQPTTFDWVI